MTAGRERRPGRPTGDGNSRERVLTAARQVFAQRGYDGASLRSIAAEADVDPGMVRHFFQSKAGLFRAAMQSTYPDAMLSDVLVGGPDGLAERLLRRFLAELDATGSSNPMVSMIRSAVSHEESTQMLRAFVTEHVLARVAATVDAPDRTLRATLVGTQIIGLVMARYIVRIEPLASADSEVVIRAVAPTIQRYLTGDLD